MSDLMSRVYSDLPIESILCKYFPAATGDVIKAAAAEIRTAVQNHPDLKRKAEFREDLRNMARRKPM